MHCEIEELPEDLRIFAKLLENCPPVHNPWLDDFSKFGRESVLARSGTQCPIRVGSFPSHDGEVFPPGDAARTEDRQGRHGAETGGSHVLDVAQGMGLRTVDKVRFARGTTWKSPWCAVEHRAIDWVSRSPSRGSSKE